MWCDFTIIDWEHDQQFAQFNLEDHDKILQQIARVLKTSRLVDENLYYLGNGQFLIISNTIAPGTLMVLNDELKAELKGYSMGNISLLLKWQRSTLQNKIFLSILILMQFLNV